MRGAGERVWLTCGLLLLAQSWVWVEGYLSVQIANLTIGTDNDFEVGHVLTYPPRDVRRLQSGPTW